MPQAFTRFVSCSSATPGRSDTTLVCWYSPSRSRSPQADAGIQASVKSAAARNRPRRRNIAAIVVSFVIFSFILNFIVGFVLVHFLSASGWQIGRAHV